MTFDRDALLPIFLAEAEEGLEMMEQCVIAIEDHTDDGETLASLFRHAHTLKGNSSSLGFNAIADVTHVLEDLLHRARDRELQMTPALVALLLEAIDVLRALVHHSAQGRDEPAPGQAELLQALRTASAPGSVPAPRPFEAAAAPAASESAAPRARDLRVSLDKLDRLLTLVGEIAVARGRIGPALEALGEPAAAALEAHREAERLDHELHELAIRARMVPLGPTFRQYTRIIRDLSLACDKPARLAIEGADVEADLIVVERLRDPLTHVVRNALDHGIEPAADRQARGKDPVATITLRARHEAAQLVVEVADDGAGLDRERVLARGRERGLFPGGVVPSDRDLHEIVFEPGFSTAERVTELSGRGVGMDVVRRNVASLRGSVDLSSREGLGTVLTIRVPLTLTVMPGLLVDVGGERYVVPIENVRECLDLAAGEDAGQGAGVAEVRGELLPYLRARRLLAAPGDAAARETLIVIEHEQERIGLAVDELLGQAQVVVKPLARPLQGVPGISGSTILGDGRVALILDPAAMASQARLEGRA